MNYRDFAAASGQMPPEVGLCAHCKKRREVDWVSVDGHVLQLCRKCQDKLDQDKDLDPIPDPKELPF